ncbi:hypothetical protein V1264_021372 [Littorina saxatilis]|uniref:Group XV phospholipase A2 n=2 Tax=Littorina saxatilis TaxID=31220 RepID=A0AAN9FVC6_9CAEN
MGNGKAGDYYYYIVHALEAKGYTANKDIKGAPYDFRKAPDNLNEFYRKLKKLVEDLYHANQNVPVVMIAHSMGNPVLLNFYNHKVTKEWKDTYIHAHVALAPPWAGSIKSVRGMVSGDSDGIFFLNGLEVRPMQRSWPGIAWMMPSPIHKLWNPEETLVVTPHRNYSVKDYNKLFHDMGYDLGFLLLNRTRQFDTDLSKLPELRALHVLYGANMPTPSQYVYPAGTFPDSDPQVKNGKGDGTVNKRSLEAFKKFEGSQSINLTHQAFDGVDHLSILSDDHVLKFITDLILNYEDSSGDNLSQDREKTEL